MAFLQRLINIMPSMGSPIQNDAAQVKTSIALSTTSAQTNTLSGISPTFTKGYVRVKVGQGGGTAPTLLNLQVVVSDGTTFVLIGAFTPVVATAPLLSLVAGGTVIGGANGSITSGAAILTSASAPFTPAMVGSAISLSNAGVGGILFYTTILSYTSATSVTLANNAGATTTTAVMTLTSTYGNAGVLATSVGGVDFVFPFCQDLACTQISFLTTLGGTTPLAQMDVEVSATQ